MREERWDGTLADCFCWAKRTFQLFVVPKHQAIMILFTHSFIFLILTALNDKTQGGSREWKGAGEGILQGLGQHPQELRGVLFPAEFPSFPFHHPPLSFPPSLWPHPGPRPFLLPILMFHRPKQDMLMRSLLWSSPWKTNKQKNKNTDCSYSLSNSCHWALRIPVLTLSLLQSRPLWVPASSPLHEGSVASLSVTLGSFVSVSSLPQFKPLNPSLPLSWFLFPRPHCSSPLFSFLCWSFLLKSTAHTTPPPIAHTLWCSAGESNDLKLYSGAFSHATPSSAPSRLSPNRCAWSRRNITPSSVTLPVLVPLSGIIPFLFTLQNSFDLSNTVTTE